MGVLLMMMLSCSIFGQEVRINGIVLGMAKEKGLKLSKKYELEGALNRADVKIIDQGKIVQQIKTDVDGNFAAAAPLGKLYLMMIEKEGYLSTGILIDTRKTALPGPGVLNLNHAEIVLVKAKMKEPQMIGRMHYDLRAKKLAITPNQGLSKDLSAARTLVLMRDAINDGHFKFLNATSNKEEEPATPKKIKYRWKKSVDEEGQTDSTFERYNPILEITNKVDVRAIKKADDLKKARADLDDLWQYATTAEDSLILKQQEALLAAAEQELARTEKLLQIKEDQLSAVYARNIWLIIALILLMGMIGFGVKYYLDRRKTFLKIREYNRKIDESIEVASRIQNSVFNREEELSDLFADHFVFNQPRDGVSGDFYWFAEANNKVIVAVSDCTGHGVPGCLLSLLGNQLLHEIVIEKRITSPDEVLVMLHDRLVKHLQQDKNFSAEGGMDIAICEIDKNAKSINFAGAMNAIYTLEGGELKSYRGDFLPIGGMGLRTKKKIERKYKVQTINYKEGDALFMFSDGLIDQFGGPDNKKFGLDQFKDFISGSQSRPLEERHKELKQQLDKWMGHQYEQIDDVMVVGLRF